MMMMMMMMMMMTVMTVMMINNNNNNKMMMMKKTDINICIFNVAYNTLFKIMVFSKINSFDFLNLLSSFCRRRRCLHLYNNNNATNTFIVLKKEGFLAEAQVCLKLEKINPELLSIKKRRKQQQHCHNNIIN